MVSKVDGTMIHSQEKGEDDFEINLGITYELLQLQQLAMLVPPPLAE